MAGADAQILILGSLPGQRSLQLQEYYAHPQNAFWRIMQVLTGAEGSYEQRCKALLEHRIALWDVLGSSVRPGSLDSDIKTEASEANDFKTFFLAHARIERIGFNGQKSAQLFGKLVQSNAATSGPKQMILPSTSPAYASMTFSEKLERWRTLLTGE